MLAVAVVAVAVVDLVWLLFLFWDKKKKRLCLELGQFIKQIAALISKDGVLYSKNSTFPSTYFTNA